MRQLIVCLAVAVVVAASAAPSAQAREPRATAAGAGPLVRVVADPGVRGPRIPRSFLGFSQEYNLIAHYTGVPETGLNRVTAGLFGQLAHFRGGAPTLRVGGGSTDDAWWNPDSRPNPPGLYIGLRQPVVDGLQTFTQVTGSRALLGLNFAFGSREPALAVDWARVARSALGRSRLLGFEAGNEPNFLPRRKYRDADGQVVPYRPSGYGPADYRREVGPFLDKVGRAVPGIALGAPGIALEPSWVRSLPALLRRHRSRLDELTIHHYPLSCGLQAGPRATRLALGNKLLTSSIRLVRGIVKVAHRHRRPVRISETNLIACGGLEGLSDRFAAGLWALDWSFGMAAAGVSGLNFHTSSPLYWPFGSWTVGPRRFAGAVGPVFYGMLVFAEATANRARLLPSAYHAARRSNRLDITSWGVYDKRRREVRVVLVNKESRKSGRAVIRVPGARGAGRVKHLRAPSLTADRGWRWGGQAYGSPTYDGRLEGRERTRRVPRRRGASFRFRLRRASAALLTVPVRRPR